MNPISSAMAKAQNELDASLQLPEKDAPQGSEQAAEVSRQFEAILMRQFLSESMKPLLEGGPSGQVYGYLVTDSLAETMTKGGGLGLSHILQAQLTR